MCFNLSTPSNSLGVSSQKVKQPKHTTASCLGVEETRWNMVSILVLPSLLLAFFKIFSIQKERMAIKTSVKKINYFITGWLIVFMRTTLDYLKDILYFSVQWYVHLCRHFTSIKQMTRYWSLTVNIQINKMLIEIAPSSIY